jgi:hypothetical protein
MTKSLQIKAKTSVSYYMNKTKRILETNDTIELIGLEGAIVVCLDIANALVREGLMVIVTTETSYTEIKSKVLREMLCRAGIKITLHRNPSVLHP